MNPVSHPPILEAIAWPVLPADTPIIYEDEEDEANDMGEANRHYGTNNVLFNCVQAHLRKRWPRLQAYANMNCYYAPGPPHPGTGSLPYFTSDVMVVDPFEPLSEDVVSYTIGLHGPAPLGALEVLSKATAETNDKEIKVLLYARLKVGEYILIDPTGKFLEERLLLKQLQPNGAWKDIQDDDGGVTSKLGFRLLLDEHDKIVVVDAVSARRYFRPDEVEGEAEARQAAEKKARTAVRRAEAAAKRADVEARRADVEARRADVEARRAEAEAKRADAEKEANRRAEERAEAEAEARRLADEQVRALQAELARLRQSPNETK